MKKIVHVLLSVIKLSSCHERSEEEKLLPGLYGHWLPVGYTTDSGNTADYKPMRLPGQLEQGFSFDSNGIADVKRGYYKVLPAKEKRDWRFIFLGTKTEYNIKGDSLKIFNLSDSTWWGLKIIKLSKDTLLIHYKPNVNWTFVRKEYQLDSVPTFDKIAVSSSGCYGGICQISNTIVSSDGEVTFFGEGYTTKKGYYTGTVTKKLYQELEDDFRKAGIDSLPNEYPGYIDGETLTVTFTKGDSIYKTIINGNDGPDELAWAYQPFRFLYQSVDLKPLPESKLPYYPAYHYLKFEKGEKELVLPQSESFLLWDYLRKGKVTEESFERRFKMNYEKNSNVSTRGQGMIEGGYDREAVEAVKEIVTDGRYYRFAVGGRESVTIDIGFNYFDRNYSMDNFTKKCKY